MDRIPSGAMTSFRPPRLRKVSGMRTVRVRPSRLISALDITQPSAALASTADLGDKAGEPAGPQAGWRRRQA